MPDPSEHIVWPEHASLHVCTLYAFVHRPIFQPDWVWLERSRYLWIQEWELAGPVWAHSLSWARKLVCMHPTCLCAQAHISVILGLNRKIKVSMELEEHARPVWVHSLNKACKIACIHAMCLCAQAHISARLSLIRKIKVSMESGDNASPDWAYKTPQACKLECMHTMCLLLGIIYQPTGWDQRDQGIYRIRRTYWTCLST